MVNRLRATFTSLLVCGGLALTACASSGDYAYGLSAEDLTGTWTADGDGAATLQLTSGGTASAASWPATVMCSGEGAEYSDELQEAPTVDFDGTWDFDEGKKGNILPDLKIDVADDVCPDDQPHGFVWRDSDDRLSMCFPLRTVEPDSFRANRMLVLRLEGERRSTQEHPCVY